ncbi:MAG TPA: hypothetical protein VGR40_12260, partial [Candidatus Binatus sp.]|nr:hypothetical protein [Candidatus Binatus sp.]
MIAAVIAIAMLIFAASPSFAAGTHEPIADAGEAPENPGAALELMAQQKFGPALSAAERKLTHFAPMRDVPWFGPSDSPDDPANDVAHAEKWGPERNVRAQFVEWLLTNPRASQLIHPSGLALAAARITGNLDLSYDDIQRPLTLIHCYVPDGINLGSAQLPGITLRRSRTGAIFANGATIRGDTAFMTGDYGPVNLMRARIDGTLDSTGSRILGAGEDSVNLVEASVSGDALFQDGFTTDGIIYSRLAKIGHDLS